MAATTNSGWSALGILMVLFSVMRLHEGKAIPQGVERGDTSFNSCPEQSGLVLKRGKRIVKDQCCDFKPGCQVCCVFKCPNETKNEEDGKQQKRDIPPNNSSCPVTTDPSAALLYESGNLDGGNKVQSIVNMMLDQNSTMVLCSGSGKGGNNVTSVVNCFNKGVMIGHSGNGEGGNSLNCACNLFGGDSVNGTTSELLEKCVAMAQNWKNLQTPAT